MQNFTKAFEYYQNLLSSRLFDYIARWCLGYLYACGEGVKFDNDLVLGHLERHSCIKVNLFCMAQIFYYGDEAIRNHKTSYKYLLKAAYAPNDQGLYLIKRVDESDLKGQSNLANGVYSLVSRGVVDGEVEYLLGIMLEKGQGTRVNYKEAFVKFSKAAKCGNKRAKNHLKLYYKDKKFIK
jgi:TPR repeat protein